MVRTGWVRHARTVLALAVVLLVTGTTRAAEPAPAPERGPDIKALFDRALEGWDDPAERQAILREIHDLFSWRVEQIQNLLRENLDAAHEAAEQLVRQASELIDMKQDRPREYERATQVIRLEGESFSLARKARQAQGPARDTAVAELKAKLAETFDAKQEAMKRDLAAMEAGLRTSAAAWPSVRTTAIT